MSDMSCEHAREDTYAHAVGETDHAFRRVLTTIERLAVSRVKQTQRRFWFVLTCLVLQGVGVAAVIIAYPGQSGVDTAWFLIFLFFAHLVITGTVREMRRAFTSMYHASDALQRLRRNRAIERERISDSED